MPHSLLLDRNTWAYLKIRDTLNFKFRRLKEHGSWRCQSSKRHPHQSKSSNHINHSNHLKKDIKQSSTNHQPIINQSSTNHQTSQLPRPTPRIFHLQVSMPSWSLGPSKTSPSFGCAKGNGTCAGPSASSARAMRPPATIHREAMARLVEFVRCTEFFWTSLMDIF